VGSVTTPLAGVIGGAATGAVIGLMQWLALRRLALTPWWIAATAAGMSAGLGLGIALLGTDTAAITLPLRGLVTGAGIGSRSSPYCVAAVLARWFGRWRLRSAGRLAGW